MIAIVTLSVELLTGFVVAIVWKLMKICMHSQSFLAIQMRRFMQARRRIRDADERAGHRNGARPIVSRSICKLYGLALTSECGVTKGP
jgi:hypothetical protein